MIRYAVFFAVLVSAAAAALVAGCSRDGMASVRVFLALPGAYRFKFWRSDSTFLDTTFTVK